MPLQINVCPALCGGWGTEPRQASFVSKCLTTEASPHLRCPHFELKLSLILSTKFNIRVDLSRYQYYKISFNKIFKKYMDKLHHLINFILTLG